MPLAVAVSVLLHHQDRNQAHDGSNRIASKKATTNGAERVADNNTWLEEEVVCLRHA